jgi:NAD(P)-dependent dehydrogenase (short-subunit alcohol dehydrogenase family)
MAFALTDLPDLHGQTAVITGATGGLGYETALALAGAGASVTLTGRNAKKGADALAAIRNIHPRADISYEPLDLASLRAVAAFATHFKSHNRKLDILVNNAGVMAPPSRQETADGFELQFETNYLSHFALTAHLLPLLRAAHGRVVSLSSVAARRGRIDFDDLQAHGSYVPFVSYSQSKLATLMFGYELQRRSEAAGWGINSIIAHPGVAQTALVANGMGSGGTLVSSITARAASFFISIFGQSQKAGALPQIFAAASPQAAQGGYYGSTGFQEIRGPVGVATPPARALDVAAGSRLWRTSEDLLKIWFPELEPAA